MNPLKLRELLATARRGQERAMELRLRRVLLYDPEVAPSEKQATLNLVAPGIAEALIATAMGLFAAIPAVVAYNKYANSVQRLENRYDDFVEEFSNILQRQAHTRAKKR